MYDRETRVILRFIVRKQEQNAPKKIIIRKKSSADELRLQAEEKLSKSRKDKESQPETKADTLRLIHELQVHQIELEMQNNVLAQSHAETEAALRQYADLYNSAPVGYLTLTRDGSIYQVNPAAASLLGMEHGKLVRRCFGVFVADQSRAVFNTFLENLFTSRKKATCEVALLKNGKGLVWVQIEADCAASQRQDEICHAIVSDITARKQAEEAVRASNEAQYHRMFTNHSAVMWLVDPDTGEIVEANAATADFYGYPVETLQQMNIGQINVLPVQEIQRLRLEVYAGRFKYFSVPHRLASGEIREVEIHSALVEVNGRSLLYSIIHDITERKRLDAALKESKQIAEAIFEFTPDALLMVEENGRITRVNKQTQIMFGYAREELLGQKIDLLIPQRFHSNHAQHAAGFFAETHPRPMGAGLEIFAVKRDGSEFPADILLSPLRLNDKAYVTVAVRDITGRKQVEAALREAQALIAEKEQLLAATKEREHLARDLHDGIGQTLGYMSMQIDLVQGLLQGDRQSGVKQMLSNLGDTARQTNREVREYILGLNKGARPAVQQEFFFTLQEYCRRIRQEYQFGIDLFLPETLPDVLASAAVETQLTYIIREALQNARKHSGSAQASLTIEVGDEFVQAVVEDTGTGWSGTEHRKGAHFGMGVMRSRAEEVGGTLQVESLPEKGMRITARLPRKLAEENLSRLRILLADDHPLFIDGVQTMLLARGANVIGIAKDGIEALEITRALKPDLILMDINMPRMNGLEVTRSIKAEAPGIKIVMLTTSIDENDLFAALSAGAAGYLLKGMNADEFTTLLAEIAYGEALFSSDMAVKMLNIFARPELQISPTQPRDQFAGLNETQHNVLNMIAQGLTYKEIGTRLFLTERTVKYHMGEILKRLQLKGRRAAEEYARRRKMG